MIEEPVSPELVLVDPELAARMRTTGAVSDCLAPRPRAAAPPAPPAVEHHRRMDRLRTTVLIVSLAINAVLLGAAWSDGIGSSAPPSLPVVVHVNGTVPEIGDAAQSTPAAPATGGGADQPPCHPSATAAPSGTLPFGCPLEQPPG